MYYFCGQINIFVGRSWKLLSAALPVDNRGQVVYSSAMRRGEGMSAIIS